MRASHQPAQLGAGLPRRDVAWTPFPHARRIVCNSKMLRGWIFTGQSQTVRFPIDPSGRMLLACVSETWSRLPHRGPRWRAVGRARRERQPRTPSLRLARHPPMNPPHSVDVASRSSFVSVAFTYARSRLERPRSSPTMPPLMSKARTSYGCRTTRCPDSALLRRLLLLFASSTPLFESRADRGRRS